MRENKGQEDKEPKAKSVCGFTAKMGLQCSLDSSPYLLTMFQQGRVSVLRRGQPLGAFSGSWLFEVVRHRGVGV